MVLYSRGVWNALFFIACYWRTDVYKKGWSPALLFNCFGRGTERSTSRSRGRLGSSRVMPGLLSEPIWCKKPEIGDEDSASLRCPWCSRYRRRKWTRRHEFKSWTRLIAFYIALIPLGKVWIQLFSLQLWVNSRTDWVLQPWWGN